MIIKSIELENIRSYKSSIVNFDYGINFLSGDIGSGKSSILQAIEFAFFGFKRGDLEGFHLIRKGETIAFVKLILIDDDNNIVEIFRKIKKSKSSGNILQEPGYIKIGSNLIELAPSEMNAMIFEILNLPRDFISRDKNLIYRFTIYTPQEQLKEVLFADDEKRLEIIRKIFDIDKYKKIKNAISIYSSKIREDKKIYQTKLESKTEFLEILKKYNIEISELQTKKLDLESKEKEIIIKLEKYKLAEIKRDDLFDKINNNLLIVEKNISKIEEIILLNDKLELDLNLKDEDSKNNSVDKLILELKKLEKEEKYLNSNLIEISSEKERLLKLKKQIEVDKLNKENLEKEVFNLNSKKEIYDNEKKSFDYILTKCQLKDLGNNILKFEHKLKNKNKLKNTFLDNENKILKLKIEIENLKEKSSNLKLQKNDISKIDICPVCVQNVGSDHKKFISKKFVDDLVNISDESKLKSELLAELIVEIENLNTQLEVFEKNELLLVESEQRYKILLEKEILEKVRYDNLKSLKIEILILEKKNYNINLDILNKKLLNSEKNLVDIENIQKTEIKINGDISKIKIDVVNCKNKLDKFESLETEILNIKNNILENKNKIIKLSDFKNKLKILNEKNIKVKSDKDKIRVAIENLLEKEKLILNNLSSFNTQIIDRNNLIKEYLEKINVLKIIENKLEKLINIEDILMNKLVSISNNIEMKVFTKYYVEFNEEFEKLFRNLIEDNDIDVRLDMEFKPIVEQNGYDISITNLSGGEKSSLAIAYRLGLKKIIENNASSKQKLSLLILDEPTDGFSNEQIHRLGTILKDINLKQILLVSHDEKIESISDKVLYVEKINHISKIV